MDLVRSVYRPLPPPLCHGTHSCCRHPDSTPPIPPTVAAKHLMKWNGNSNREALFRFYCSWQHRTFNHIWGMYQNDRRKQHSTKNIHLFWMPLQSHTYFHLHHRLQSLRMLTSGHQADHEWPRGPTKWPQRPIWNGTRVCTSVHLSRKRVDQQVVLQ